MFSVSSIHLVMDYNLPFILSNVFVLSLFCKIWAFDSSKLLSRNKSYFSVSTVFLGSVDSYLRLLWLKCLSDSISFLPAIAIINNGLYRCLLFSFSFLSARFIFCFGEAVVFVLVWVVLFLKSSPGNFACLVIYLENSHCTILLVILYALSHLAFDSKCCFLIPWTSLLKSKSY